MNIDDLIKEFKKIKIKKIIYDNLHVNDKMPLFNAEEIHIICKEGVRFNHIFHIVKS